MDFQVSGLDYAEFAPLFAMTDEQLHQRNIVRRVADARPGFPCRVSLQDVQPGETVLLMNFEHLAVASPYRARHAIYVRENARRAELATNEIPEVMRTRVLSLRAFDRAGMMLDADVAQGKEVAPVIQRMLANADVEFIHAHNAKQGCYSARIDRAG
ncbi:MAG TPA: DUF1203 domain-containing protein [Steroidobacteraceae bacterium]|jgi:hypothetical protein|nr:DUF1203 domain-containing protein [Steroidobacteraceae bacterium]